MLKQFTICCLHMIGNDTLYTRAYLTVSYTQGTLNWNIPMIETQHHWRTNYQFEFARFKQDDPLLPGQCAGQQRETDKELKENIPLLLCNG